MSSQNGQPLIEATRSETSGTSPFCNFPDFAIEAPSAFAARRIGGQCAMTFVVFNTSPNSSRSLVNSFFRIGSPPSSSISRTRGIRITFVFYRTDQRRSADCPAAAAVTVWSNRNQEGRRNERQAADSDRDRGSRSEERHVGKERRDQ